MLSRLMAFVVVVVIMVAAKMPQTVTWKAVICYGAGYCLRDENNKEIIFSLNSHHLIKAANEKAKQRGVQVKLEYYSEEIDGLKPDRPWGPAELPY